MMVPIISPMLKKIPMITMCQLPKKRRVLCGWPITMLAMTTCCGYRVLYMEKNKSTIWLNKIPKLENCGQLMSLHKSIHNFYCRWWNWISSKTHLRYWRDISVHMKYFLFGGLKSEKTFVEYQEMCVHCFIDIGCCNWWYLSNHRTKWNYMKYPFEMT